MKIRLKDLIFDCHQWGLFLSGALFGIVLLMIFMLNKPKVNIVELELNKIIKVYANDTAKSSKEVSKLEQDFKLKFDITLKSLFPKAIIVNKKHLLSKHKSIDGTKEFIEEFKTNG